MRRVPVKRCVRPSAIAKLKKSTKADAGFGQGPARLEIAPRFDSRSLGYLDEDVAVLCRPVVHRDGNFLQLLIFHTAPAFDRSDLS
jgi:hypothetical protein